MTFRRTIIALCLAMAMVLAGAALSLPDRPEGGGADCGAGVRREVTHLRDSTSRVGCRPPMN